MENLPAIVAENRSLFFDIAMFEHAQRVSKILASSDLVPPQFKDNVANCMIALNYADRIKADPFMVLQNLCVIHGKPGVEGKLIIALVNQSGRFEPLEFEETGNLKEPKKDSDGCLAFSKDIKSGKILKGPMIDWSMVKGEGWYNKTGSKWKSGLAPLMFRYRAATYFARTYCPEVLLGMSTKEELHDFVDMQEQPNGTYSVQDLNDKISAMAKDTVDQPNDQPEPTKEPPPAPKATKAQKDILTNLAKIAEVDVKEVATWYRQGDELTKAEAEQLTENWDAEIEKFKEVTK